MRKLRPVLIFVLGILFATQVNSQETNDKAVLELVKKDASKMQIGAEDAANMSVSSSYFDTPSGILYVYLQQRYQQIKVHNSIISAAYRNNQLLYSSGKFISGISSKAGQGNATLGAIQAVSKAAEQLGLKPAGIRTLEDRSASEKKVIVSPSGIAKHNIETEMFWISVDNGSTIQLAWNVNIDVLNSSDWWNVFVNAANGSYITKYNWTVYDHFGKPADKKNKDLTIADAVNDFQLTGEKFMSPPNVTNATYKVVPFPKESPSHGAPVNVSNPWEMAGTGNNATTHGWHFDGTTNYDITRGNNVFAFLDVTATNLPNGANNWPDTSTTSAPTLTFVNTPNLNTTPRAVQNKKFALDNLFYWNNLMHDVYYQYGFTEAAGNFQKDNLGRGGQGNDWVNAQAQDGAGTDNANFSVPNDGSNGRMRMYLFSGPSFINISSPSSIAGNYLALEGAYSTANLLKNVGPISGQVIYYNDDAAGSTHDACAGAPANSITGKVALINRGNCDFVIKIKNAQTAGAIGVIMVNNVAGDPLVMGGADNTITIPSVMITQADGATLAAQLAAGVNVTITEGGRDGDLDNSIVTHEYGHGISIRLTGGPANSACLTNAEQGGEGWSDYFGLMMTTNWNTATVSDGATARPVGTYAMSDAVNGSGIRRFPYSTNLGVNPLTYSDMVLSTEVHDIGEIWCAALWDMTWGIIQQTNTITPNIYNANGTGGNVIALNLVMMGLKLQPCGPGFLDSRNAILAADSILYNNAHKCIIWNAFARRGMGASAVQGNATSASDQTAAFDLPSGLVATKPTPSVVNTGSNFTYTTSTSCNCQPLSGYVIRDTIPAGFTVVNSSPAGTLNGNVFSFNASNWAAQENKSFSLTLQATTSGCNVDSVINDNRDGSNTGGLTSTTTGAGGGWASSALKPNTGANSWLGAEPATISQSYLTSSSSAANSGQNLSIVSFYHSYNTEKGFDGGVVEYSTDGTNWNDAGSLFIKNGYNGVMDAATELPGRKAFTGNSNGYIQSILDFGPLSTMPFAIRFRTSSDNGTGGEGWFVDDIVKSNGCGGMIKTGIYNGSGARVDTMWVPVFVKSLPSSITINSQPASATVCVNQNTGFTVSASSVTTLSYQWQVSTNGGGSFSNINGETGSVLTLNAVTASLNNNRYRCVITDATSTLNSTTVTLTVNNIALIATQPTDKNVCIGSDVSFTVSATNATSYQWQVSTDGGANFSNISGATNTTLTFTPALAQNSNKYRCVITNACGTINTNVVNLTVADVKITASPANLTICEDAGGSFSVTATGTALTYQWQVSFDNGANFQNMTGQNSSTLTLPKMSAQSNNSQYRCLVTAPCGVLTSAKAILTVISTPINIASLPTRICESDASIQLSATPTGGTWTGTGVSGTSFTPSVAHVGTHQLIYTVTAGPGCISKDTVDARVEDCVDRNLTFANNGILLYPNPNEGEFFIRLNSLLYSKFSVRVYNSTGQLVHTQQFNNLQYGSVSTVNLKQISVGVYHVKVYTETGSAVDEKTFTILIRR